VTVGIVIVGLAATVIGWAALVWRVAQFARGFAQGQPELPGARRDRPGRRTLTLVGEFLGHKRLRRKPVVAAAHWLVMVSFLVLVLTLAQATGQLFDPGFELPWLGWNLLYNWATEFFAWAGLLGVLALIAVRLAQSAGGRSSRFFGSHQWRARYVEATILAVCLLVLWLRAVEAQLLARGPHSSTNIRFPITHYLGLAYAATPAATLETLIQLLALAKILVSYAWMVVVALTPTMGVAWHRFLAFVTVWTAKHADGRPALGGLDPLVVGGKPVDLNDPDTDEAVYERLGVGTAADLTWRDLLGLTTCTECGRCQEVCPAWGAGKALSPKLFANALRDHAWAEWPVGRGEHTPLVAADAAGAAGAAAGETAQTPLQRLALTEDMLWACTTCGACVAVCPVGVEHVDHVIDLRRRRVLGDAEFPAELATLFRNLERRQNPWGVVAKKRLDWTAGLDFQVPVVGADVEDLDGVDYLYWVGCAGAFDARGQATARAFATLLKRAGVKFAVLGTQECCTGDPARRAGNEPLFAELAARGVTALNEAGATRIVVTCAHCFNALKNEAGPFGGHYDVVHHTQLLAGLIAQGRLKPGTTLAKPPLRVTFQDPCYLARHNGETTAPRSLLAALPGVKLQEMAPCGPDTRCCGAGGARMWQEEAQANRLNARRAADALATGAEAIATACPYCSVMLGDAVAASDQPDVPVRDVAQLVLDSLPGGDN
jgi:Fe-S oxidoreductase